MASPLSIKPEVILSVRIGDDIFVCGTVITAGHKISKAHKFRICLKHKNGSIDQKAIS